MRTISLCFLLVFFVSCEQSQKISEKEVMDTFNEFFYYLDNDVDNLSDCLSEDFVIFEVGRKWNADEFIEFVKGFGEFQSKRGFKNIKINTDINSAHLSLEHSGEFQLENPTPEGLTSLSYEWLESAYLVKEEGKLKFKFYFSEQIND
jgi:hypothetical protein|tara:strand:+ start:2394 stop:2837 length:444 start_codon:yes stop_codon:yes gene_type:complete